MEIVKVGYYQLKGLATLDIDNEEDFLLAEAIIMALKNKRKMKLSFMFEGEQCL